MHISYLIYTKLNWPSPWINDLGQNRYGFNINWIDEETKSMKNIKIN